MKKVLIIDDDAVFVQTMSDRLSADYQVVSASNGKEGLVAFKKEQPDLVLLDILMPEMTGIDMLQQLRQTNPDVETPIIITSNLSGMEEISSGMALGARGYLIKSVESLDTIKETVDQFISS